MPIATLSSPAETAPLRPRLSESRVAGYIVLGLIVAVICTYALIVRADFIAFDDNSHVYENRLVKAGLSWHGLVEAFKPHASLWVPLTWISFMVDVSIFGMNPGAIHAVNLAWHVGSTVLLFLTLRRITGRVWASAFVAALFGLHPMNVESVAWIAERKNVLSTFWWLAAIAAYVHYAEKPRVWPYLATLLCAVLALLAKPMVVTLPATLLLLDFWPLNRWRTTDWKRLLLEKAPFLLLSLGTSWMATHARRDVAVVTTETLPVVERVSNALVSYVAYLRDLFVPVNLGVFYPHPLHTPLMMAAAAAVFLLAVTVVAAWSWKTRPYLIVGWLWFLGVLVPVIGLVQVGSQGRADRFSYVPQIGLFVAITWLAIELWPKAVCARRWVALGVLLICAVLTSRQVSYWIDGLTLFEHTIAVTKDNACAYANAGLNRARVGDPLKAIEYYQASLRIQPDQAMVWREFGVALVNVSKPKDATAAFRMALRYDPHDFESRYKLAVNLQDTGAAEESIALLGGVLQDLPHAAGAHYYLARALELTGRHDAALAEVRMAAQFAPGHPKIASALTQMEAGSPGVAAFPEL